MKKLINLLAALMLVVGAVVGAGRRLPPTPPRKQAVAGAGIGPVPPSASHRRVDTVGVVISAAINPVMEVDNLPHHEVPFYL